VLFAVTFGLSFNFVLLCVTFQYTCDDTFHGELCEYLCSHLLPPTERKFLRLFIAKLPFGMFSYCLYININDFIVRLGAVVFIVVAMENLKL